MLLSQTVTSQKVINFVQKVSILVPDLLIQRIKGSYESNSSWRLQQMSLEGIMLLHDYFYKVGLGEVLFVSQNMQESRHFLQQFKSSQAKRTAEAIALCEALSYLIDTIESTTMM